MSSLTVATAIGCALIGGVFFAFSTFVMPALARLSPSQAIQAMQSINVTVLNPWFLGAFLGSAVACAIVGGHAVMGWSQPGAGLRLAGALLYLLGAVAVTIAGNVPLNERLDAMSPDAVDAPLLWSRYLASWTGWNHVRTAAALAAAVLLLAGSCWITRPR